MTIIIKNMSEETNEFILESVFARFGVVDSAKVIYDRHTNESKGIGFVEMPNDEEAKKAIETMNESQLSGNTVEVAEAEDRSKKFKIRF